MALGRWFALGAMAALLATGCSGTDASDDPPVRHSGSPGPVGVTEREQTLTTPAGRFLVTTVAGNPWEQATAVPSPSGPAQPCAGSRATGGGGLVLSTYPADCPAPDNRSPGNGRHGRYRSAADIDPAHLPERVRTPVGEAVLFTQDYFEATNSVRRWNEPVAVITLDTPASANHPVITVISHKGEMNQAELRRFLEEGLRPAP